MKKVITYGTYDLFHEGHRRLLERAKELGDYLIVGVTTENFDHNRGKLNVQEGLMRRIENIKSTGLADEIIIEEYEGQKIDDIQRYDVDTFAIGSDWMGKFDYIKEYCEVVYLERTKGISSTQLRAENNGMLKLGMIGCGDIADKFINESKYVSGVNIEGIYGPDEASAQKFSEKHELAFSETNYDAFLDKVDAVYIASPNLTHYEYIKKALEKGKHVLCETPIVLSKGQACELYALAADCGCVLLEAAQTAFSPGFIRLISIAKSGLIGQIKNVDATFTRTAGGNSKVLNTSLGEGSVTSLATYPLLVIMKLLGNDIENVDFYSYFDEETQVDLFTKINLKYCSAIASAKVGLGVQSEGDLVISGTKGYIYVKSPWWRTESFEIRFLDSAKNKKHFYKFEGDGLRYELAEFVSMVQKGNVVTYKLTPTDSIKIKEILEQFINRKQVQKI